MRVRSSGLLVNCPLNASKHERVTLYPRCVLGDSRYDPDEMASEVSVKGPSGCDVDFLADVEEKTGGR